MTERPESVIEMEETPVEEEARRIKLLEEAHQNFIESRALWEKRKADNYPGAELMIALLDADLRINVDLIERAKRDLVRLSSMPE